MEVARLPPYHGLSPPVRGILLVACGLPSIAFASHLDSRFRGNDGVETGNGGAKSGTTVETDNHRAVISTPLRHCALAPLRQIFPERPPR